MDESCSAPAKWQVQRCAVVGGFGTSQMELGPVHWHPHCGAQQLIRLLDAAECS